MKLNFGHYFRSIYISFRKSWVNLCYQNLVLMNYLIVTLIYSKS
jgi:hypothetical protein